MRKSSILQCCIESGPAFPAQTEPPEKYLRLARRAIEASGILEWVDWDQSIFDES